jgi:hypothetical protein
MYVVHERNSPKKQYACDISKIAQMKLTALKPPSPRRVFLSDLVLRPRVDQIATIPFNIMAFPNTRMNEPRRAQYANDPLSPGTDFNPINHFPELNDSLLSLFSRDIAPEQEAGLTRV